MATNGFGSPLAGSDLLQQWMRDGVRVRLVNVGTQKDLFTQEDKRMVAVCYGRQSVVISEDELAAIAQRLNTESNGGPLQGFQSLIRFEDDEPTRLF